MQDIEKRINNDFDYHAPPNQQIVDLHTGIRTKLREVAHEISASVPPGREASVCLTKLEEAMFWANAAIARNHAHYAGDGDHDAA